MRLGPGFQRLRYVSGPVQPAHSVDFAERGRHHFLIIRTYRGPAKTTVPATTVQYSRDTRRGRPMLLAVVLTVAVLATLGGLFFRTYHLGTKTFWGDELAGLTHTLGYTEAEIVRAGPQVRTAADIQAYFNLSGPHHSGPRPLWSTVDSLANEDQQHTPVFYLMKRLWVNVVGVL